MENSPSGDLTTAATFSLRLSHIAMVSQLTEWLGINRSAVAQQAIECLYREECDKRPKACK